jgi:nicotinate dehydrogenase subunit B
MNAPFSMDRRSFLKTAGYVTLSFAIPADLAFGQQAPAPGAAPEPPPLPGDLKNNPMLSAWFRVNADETVTLMIGKVELGQGSVTAIAQVAADELGVDMDRLQIISGDTAQVPDEGTTAGSQSMPNGALAVRHAAAEIREILYGLASAKLGQPAETMKVDNGVITDLLGARFGPQHREGGDRQVDLPPGVRSQIYRQVGAPPRHPGQNDRPGHLRAGDASRRRRLRQDRPAADL